MSLFDKVTNFLSGGIGGKVVDKVLAQFPDKLSEADRADIDAAVTAATREHELKLLDLVKEQEAEFNNRLKEMEGTAKDLEKFGWLGRIVVFLRGCQRPIWGYLTLYMDMMWFSGKWGKLTQQQESAFWIINLLVLGFLFGERAIKNLMPLISEMMKQKAGK